ncbi:hypothetical protein FQN54_001569 [Arachnomyces sp. PD_36]|nr:hypothetical protein FQN54_001569 [Arachnomyces sp. PD_36]
MSIHPFRQAELVDKPSALALAKFSYATTSAERAAPVNWTHIAGDTNLFVVFERVRVGSTLQNAQERRLLKVQKGSNILEELDLNSLVDEAAEKAKVSQPPNQSPAIAVIVKSPCLAVRYPTRNNQIRRFQIKFSLDADYYKALAILSEVGCPITQSATGTQQHRISRSISSSSLVPPSPSTSTISRYVDTASPLPGSVQVNAMPPSVAGTYRAPHTVNQARSLIGEELTRSSHGADIDDTRVSMVSSASSATVCGLGPGLPDPTSRGQMQVPIHPTQSSTQPTSYMNPKLSLSGTEPQHLQVLPSSAIAPVSPSVRNPQSLSQILPPKRELPFAKPTAKKPRNSVQRTPRKPPAQAHDFVGSHQERAVLLGANQSPMQNATAVHTPNLRDNTVSHPLSPSKNFQSSPRSSFKPAAPGSAPSPSNNIQSFDLPNTQQTPTPTNKNSNHIPILRETSVPNSPAHPNPPPVSTRMTEPSKPATPPENRNTGVLTPSDLSSYLQTPTPERSALVESWVCQQLQDDGFLKLCEDIEGVWRRVAFGR